MKYKVDWKRLLLFAIITGGLLFITGSFLVSLGIIILLLVVDRLIVEWETRRKK